jgi:uncharacterized membrane protein
MSRSQKALTGFFAFMGTMHFVIPRSFEAIMPPSLPRHREAVIVSGLAELAGGAAIVTARTRRFARWWLLGLLFAVFPANIHMAVNPEQVPGLDLDRVRAGPCGRGCRCSRLRCSGSGVQPEPDPRRINTRVPAGGLLSVELLSAYAENLVHETTRSLRHQSA